MKAEFQKKRRRDLGQVTVEYILLSVALITLFQIATNTLRDSDLLRNFQDVPNKILLNLMENGNWKVNQKDSKSFHPNHHRLHYSPDGEGP